MSIAPWVTATSVGPEMYPPFSIIFAKHCQR